MSNATTGAISGAASGAAIGSMVAPGVGTAVGAGIGFIGGLFMGAEADSAEAKAERERAFKLQEARDLEKAEREQAEQLAAAAVSSTANVGQKSYSSPTGLIGELASNKPQTSSGTF